MTTMYFKSTNGDAAKAIEEYEKAKDAHQKLFQPLADAFKAKPIFVYNIHGMHFYALAFNDYDTVADKDLWTKPDHKYGGACRIRSSVRGKGNIARLKELRGRYESLLPKEVETPSRDPFYETIGISWGDIVFSGLKLFAHEGTAYLATGLELTKNVVEITGSEFAAAEKSYNQKSE
ncbi:TPA: hypothetical protein AB5C23_001252 [Vibrio cholerae]|uniref:hypothetical protein n=1 Tax=Vibrio paracholerae TaxID=650003 RepID=UPI00207EF933|nr:hypothetical protein [Vibrio paracholerae]MCO7020945.1 hypothetical protein [Vibrio paracholerae]GHX29987.1 hypothetical protein VCSRO62_0338 [Vibrio cholerae]